MNEFFHVMMLPLLACLILVGIHAYLGFHVIERQVIFVDLALAQIAALGSCFALVLGQSLDSPQAYWLSLGFTILGAGIFSLTRFKQQRVPQEAIIGIIYVVAAALLVLVLSRSGQGDEHIRQSLTGNILLVNWADIIKMTVMYFLIGLGHFYCRKQFIMISRDPQQAIKKGWNIRLWDFIFYVSFGFVVTSSVKIAGVLLVFAFLIVPSVCAMLLCNTLQSRLLVGWVVGAIASILGIVISYYGDLPTGSTIVCVFGAILSFLLVIRKSS